MGMTRVAMASLKVRCSPALGRGAAPDSANDADPSTQQGFGESGHSGQSPYLPADPRTSRAHHHRMHAMMDTGAVPIAVRQRFVHSLSAADEQALRHLITTDSPGS